MPPNRRFILSLIAGSSSLFAANSAPRRYSFEYWDVFTRTPLAGNPLCVFLDARGLSDREMLSLARETNLSETTFVLPENRVRIWSPVEEYPFAGHPTLGTAMALRKAGMKQIVLQEKIGLVPVEFEEHTDGSIYGEMLQPDLYSAKRQTRRHRRFAARRHHRSARRRADSQHFDPLVPTSSLCSKPSLQ